jgi:hypothetical protein
LSPWEDEEELRQEFPRAPAWGQAVSKGGGDVTDAEVPSSEADAVDHDEDGIEDRGGNSKAEAQKKKM